MPPDDPIPAAPPAAAPSTVSAEPAAAVAVPAVAAASVPEPAAPTGEAPKAAEGASPGGATVPAPKEFAPSLLDEAAKTPAAEPPKPDAAPAKDAAPADGKPPAAKEPAAEPAKPDPAKAADPAKPAEPPAPIEYAFTYPEGVKPTDVDAERMGAFTGVLNDLRASPEVGQKLLNMHLDEVKRVEQAVSDRQWNVFIEQQRADREQVMADPVLGGARHDTAMRTVMQVFDAYSLRDQGSKNPRGADAIAAERKELMDDFRATGIANRRSMLSLMHWIGEQYVREGKPRPAPPPRSPNPANAQRGTGRYRNTTPLNNGG